jgi:hypothetical protein
MRLDDSTFSILVPAAHDIGDSALDTGFGILDKESVIPDLIQDRHEVQLEVKTDLSLERLCRNCLNHARSYFCHSGPDPESSVFQIVLTLDAGSSPA